MNQQTNEKRVLHVFSPSLGILYRFQEGTGFKLKQVPPKPPRDVNLFKAKPGRRYQFKEGSLTFVKPRTWWDEESSQEQKEDKIVDVESFLT